jgi:hypothetical protein
MGVDGVTLVIVSRNLSEAGEFAPNMCEIQIARKGPVRAPFLFLASSLNDDRNMNSYPPELVVQLAPVMFVAGLDVPPSPEPVSSSTSDLPSLSHPAQDPFTVLTIRLRDALLSQRITAIWQPDKSKTFQTVLVDKVRSAVLAVIPFQ